MTTRPNDNSDRQLHIELEWLMRRYRPKHRDSYELATELMIALDQMLDQQQGLG